MTIKYEPVFGDQSLFYNAQADCEMVGNGHHKVEHGKLMVWNFSEKYWAESHTSKISIEAMRRIIKTPVWTVADQKAGRLPEVGWVVMVIDVNEVARIAAINNDSVCSVCVVFEDGGFITLHFSGIAPIETPEEKAQRLKDEWKTNALGKIKQRHWTSQEAYKSIKQGIEDIYDAILSGELKAPTND